MSKAEYRAYLQTPHWRRVRIAYFAVHPKVCFVCEADQHVHLHHLTYEHLHSEPFEDLIPLCSRCHRLLHRQDWHKDSHIELRKTYLVLGSLRFAELAARRPKRKRPPGRRLRKPDVTVRGYYACPLCHALPGERCRTDSGRKRRRLHAERYPSVP